MRGPLALLLVVAFLTSAAAQSGPDITSPLLNLGQVGAQPPATASSPPLPPRADGKPPDIAFGAYQRGNFLLALGEAERRLDANPKDAAAMTLMGAIYLDGAAVARSELEASRWFRLASNLGDPQAAYELGVLMLQGGEGVDKNPAGAKEQFERAAAKSHPGALYNLGVMALDTSEGKTPDYAKAAQYFLAAANVGDDNGAYSYGVMEREGRGAPQDLAYAARWLKRASDAGVIAAQVEYAIMLFNGVGVPKDETAAVEILRLAAAKGNPIAQNRIAHLYVAGRVVERDLAKAAAWNAFAKAGGLTDQGLDVATANLTPDERKRFTQFVRERIGF